MCLIAYQPPGEPAFSESVLSNGWNGNPHGAGYMFAADGKLIIRKAFYSLKKLRKAYIADHTAYGAKSAFVLHFRWATHGSRAENNVHPHALANGDVGLVHNGILFDFDWDRTDSDTVTFCKTVLACRSVDNLMSAEFGQTLADIIGHGNKFVLMSAAGDVAIINAEEGVWDGNCWYSNTGYMPPTPREHTWTPLTAGVNRGLTFEAELLADDWQWRRKALPPAPGKPAFDGPTHTHGTLFDIRDDDYLSTDDELDRIDLEMADAYLAGDERRIEELELEKHALEYEREQWAACELAMQRDGD